MRASWSAPGAGVSLRPRGSLPCAAAARPPAPLRYLGVRAGSSAVAACACLVWQQRQMAVRSGLLAGPISLHASSIRRVERRAAAALGLGADSRLQLVDLLCGCEQSILGWFFARVTCVEIQDEAV